MDATTKITYDYISDRDSLFYYAQELIAECITAAPNRIREHVAGLAQTRSNFALSAQQIRDTDWFAIVQEFRRDNDIKALFSEPCYCPVFGGNNG